MTNEIDQITDRGPPEESEFGKGYAYCLGLFLAHEWRIREFKENVARGGASLWFNGATDHLFDLQIPTVLHADKQKEIEEWRDKCISFRRCDACTFDDCLAATQKAKDLLREWDVLHGIPCIKGGWE